ncbi:MAG TPA: phosphatidylserine/phosphatidylglycerophosphate/cardiolipin synthase family protein [Verrucomicrobiae bacterium]|nr:phosphatidylserine/phosphatidylglycerophosphate/cardiolipin synthase family protein [Verrucomicrobiae bacterium]
MDHKAEYIWLQNGRIALDAMLAAIKAATVSIRMEMYIFHTGATADEFRAALIAACQRGVKTRVLADGLGSYSLPDSFWNDFRVSGGEFRLFNPIKLSRMSIRDHRKILVCDEEVALIGGFNVASEYYGDGVKSGWRDLGMQVRGPLVRQLAEAFDEMFACADFKHKPFTRLRASERQRTFQAPDAELLLGAPGRNNPIKRALRHELRDVDDVRIMCAYFLPPWRMRRDLIRIARRGGRVQLILPQKSDVPFSRMAALSFYRRFLIAGVEIYEYEPQILHAKLFLFNDIVYVGSANLDSRSLNINYELSLRLSDARVARDARTIWERIKGRFAYWILARIDPYIALRQFE